MMNSAAQTEDYAHTGKKNAALARLLRLAFNQRLYIATAIAFSALSAILALAPAIVIWKICERLAPGQSDFGSLWILIAVAAAAFAARWILLGASTICSHIAAFATLYDLRIALAAKLTRVPLGLINERTSGSIKKIIQNDVEKLELFIAHILPDFAAAVITPLACAGLLFWLDWRLGLAGLSTLPIAFGLQAVMMSGSDELFRRQAEAQEWMNGAFVQFIQGIAIIKSFNLSASRFEQLDRSISAFRDFTLQVSRRLLPYWAVFQVGIKANLLVLVPLGSWLAMRGDIRPTDLVLALLLGLTLPSPLLRILFMAGTLKQIAIVLDRIDGILQAPEQPQASQPVALEDSTIRFVNVTFGYGDVSVLEDVTLEAIAGQTIALVGRSGAGKSTVVNLLARFWDPDDGSISIGGIDIQTIPPEDLHRTISFVFQDTFLFDDTVLANLQVANPAATRQQIVEACRLAQADAFIERLPNGYDRLVGERGGRLSGGERQRLAIARALLRDAPIIDLTVFMAEASYIRRNMERIEAVMDQPELATAGTARPQAPYDLEFDRVRFAYDDAEAQTIDQVSFVAKEGTLTALVGPSGSGKSTLTFLAARFHDVADGSIRIGGTDIRDFDIDALMADVAMVFQDVYLFQDTIAANLRVGRPDATDAQLIEAARAARAHNFIVGLPDGYQTVVGEGGQTLSGGERQRVSIARALLKDAPILLLDEATASIDPENEAAVQAAIATLVEGRTTIVIAHRLHSIINADQIVVLEGGRVAQIGTHETLANEDGLYARMWAASGMQ